MDKTNILIIVPDISNPYYLGPSSVTYSKLRGFIKIRDFLSKENIRITFLTISDDLDRKKLCENIEVLGSRRLRSITFTGELQALIKKIGGFDVVHSHILHELFPYLLSKAVKIYTVHGLPWNEMKYRNTTYTKMWIWLRGARLKLYYPKIDKLVCVSEYVENELTSKGFEKEKLIVIENSVADEFFEARKNECQLIFYPSVILPIKNHLGFLKAIAKIKDELKDFRIVFTSGNESYTKTLLEFASKNDIKIEISGRLPYQEIVRLHAASMITVSLSFEETFGMVVAEAMACGTPVVASKIPPYIEKIEDGVSGFLVDPNDTEAIAKKIIMLVDDKDLRKKLGNEARKIAEVRWRSEIAARKHLELYLHLLSEKKINRASTMTNTCLDSEIPR